MATFQSNFFPFLSFNDKNLFRNSGVVSSLSATTYYCVLIAPAVSSRDCLRPPPQTPNSACFNYYSWRLHNAEKYIRKLRAQTINFAVRFPKTRHKLGSSSKHGHLTDEELTHNGIKYSFPPSFSLANPSRWPPEKISHCYSLDDPEGLHIKKTETKFVYCIPSGTSIKWKPSTIELQAGRMLHLTSYSKIGYLV